MFVPKCCQKTMRIKKRQGLYINVECEVCGDSAFALIEEKR